MSLTVTPRENNFGAEITGIKLCEPLEVSLAKKLKEAWYRHQVLYFPDQNIDHNHLENLAKDSLITEIIKKIELKKFFDLNNCK